MVVTTMTSQNRPLYTKGEPFDIPLEQIERSVNISPRSKHITTTHVMRISRQPASGFDPILVWYKGGSYVIVDGYHRFQACCVQGAKTIRARMIYGELNGYDRLHINEPNYVPSFVLLAAYRENIPHGQHLLETERRSFVRRMVESGITDVAVLTRESELHPEMVRWLATHEYHPKTETETEDEEYHRKTVSFFNYLGRYIRYLESVGIETGDANHSAMLVSDMIETLSSLPSSKLGGIVQALNMLRKVVNEMYDRRERGNDE
jgi:ParB-like nuclease domain